VSSATFESPLGPLHLAATRRGLSHLLLPGARPPLPVGDGGTEAAAILSAVARQLAAYFAGTLRAFDLPLDLAGTPFQREVWALLREIPWGGTTTYGALARALGRPGAARAVGAANGANPVAIVVPCHRVVGADGALTGFGGGLPMKRALLDLERRQGRLI
jgi:methylated-DNA-[protein]-cysteine S-methyltransferase